MKSEELRMKNFSVETWRAGRAEERQARWGKAYLFIALKNNYAVMIRLNVFIRVEAAQRAAVVEAAKELVMTSFLKSASIVWVIE